MTVSIKKRNSSKSKSNSSSRKNVNKSRKIKSKTRKMKGGVIGWLRKRLGGKKGKETPEEEEGVVRINPIYRGNPFNNLENDPDAKKLMKAKSGIKALPKPKEKVTFGFGIKNHRSYREYN